MSDTWHWSLNKTDQLWHLISRQTGLPICGIDFVFTLTFDYTSGFPDDCPSCTNFAILMELGE